jgi:EAL domain-containing protein (putative c-di-GMP-specific phosphodiesterase class I)
MRKESGRQLMDALVTFLSRNHHNVIIEGVESEAHKEWLQGMEWFAIQGHYWRKSVLNNWSPMICKKSREFPAF